MDCCNRTKLRPDGEKRALINRLRRIEGQVRGIAGMVESDAYCVDIINQVSAISSALSAFSKELLESHIRSCVVKDISEGNDEKINELSELIKKLIK